MPMITSSSPKERENEQQDAGQSQSSCLIRRLHANWPQWATPTSAARAVLGVMRPRMQVSFLSDCDDVALPALKLDPDAEMARVVLADVEVASGRFFTMLSAVAMTASRASRYLEWIAISVPPPARLSRREWSRECGDLPRAARSASDTFGDCALSLR